MGRDSAQSLSLSPQPLCPFSFSGGFDLASEGLEPAMVQYNSAGGFFHLETKSFLIFSILILTQNEKHDHLNLQKNFRIFKQGENPHSFLINNNNSWATLKIKHNYGFLG